jgi:hypothetical protein
MANTATTGLTTWTRKAGVKNNSLKWRCNEPGAQVIRAFYIIDIITYMTCFEWYLRWPIIMYAFLVDIWDFSTKFLSLVFNFQEEENLLFAFCCLRTFWTPKNHRKNIWLVFSSRERPWAKEAREGSHDAWKILGGAPPT